MGADDEFGGPLAQADFCGSGVGSFGADATEDLLILRGVRQKTAGKGLDTYEFHNGRAEFCACVFEDEQGRVWVGRQK